MRLWLSGETQMQRRWERAERRRTRLAGRSVPVARRAYRVTVTHIELPDWAREAAIRAVSQSDAHVWLRSRTLARRLARLNRVWGGREIIDTAEYRRCPTCRRVLIGYEATEMRERIYRGESAVCGMECGGCE